jgi:hypothetical protein
MHIESLKKTLRKGLRKVSGLDKIDSLFIQDTWHEDDKFNLSSCPPLYFRSLGKKNIDKVFYVIYCNRLGGGFFANFRHVIANTIIARKNDYIPIVDFENFPTFYNEKDLVNNTSNAWEYYFKQVSPYTLEEVYQSSNVLFCASDLNHQKRISINIYNQFGRYGEIYEDHIQVHDHIVDKVKEFASAYLTEQRTLGVHFRGKEMNISSGHSFAPTIRQMISHIDAIMAKHSTQKIFLVTEEKDYLQALKTYYGDKLFFTDAFRVSKTNAYNIYPRQNHRYLLGLEVLIDAMLLARCNGLICGDSGVSEHAIAINENFEFVYKIDNGRNFVNPYLARYAYNIKKSLPPLLGGLKGELKSISLD